MNAPAFFCLHAFDVAWGREDRACVSRADEALVVFEAAVVAHAAGTLASLFDAADPRLLAEARALAASDEQLFEGSEPGDVELTQVERLALWVRNPRRNDWVYLYAGAVNRIAPLDVAAWERDIHEFAFEQGISFDEAVKQGGDRFSPDPEPEIWAREARVRALRRAAFEVALRETFGLEALSVLADLDAQEGDTRLAVALAKWSLADSEEIGLGRALRTLAEGGVDAAIVALAGAR